MIRKPLLKRYVQGIDLWRFILLAILKWVISTAGSLSQYCTKDSFTWSGFLVYWELSELGLGLGLLGFRIYHLLHISMTKSWPCLVYETWYVWSAQWTFEVWQPITQTFAATALTRNDLGYSLWLRGMFYNLFNSFQCKNIYDTKDTHRFVSFIQTPVANNSLWAQKFA